MYCPLPEPYGLECNALGLVASNSPKLGAKFLTKYVSIFLPALSFTTTFSMLAGSVQYSLYVCGSLTKN